MGTRVGRPHPKPLTPLADGRSIMRQQLDHLRAKFGADAHITIVVGFKMGLIMEAAANDAAFVYNELYDQTNTCKSLLKALRLAPPGGVLWLNGDVVFVPGLLDELRKHIEAGRTFVAVNTCNLHRRPGLSADSSLSLHKPCLLRQNCTPRQSPITTLPAMDLDGLSDPLRVGPLRQHSVGLVRSGCGSASSRRPALPTPKDGTVPHPLLGAPA